MRVIAGSARRLLLKTLPGNDTRPTTDIIKETFFNMINFDLPGAYFLDLYAGSGAMGIEALSRGAVGAVFVDNNAKAVSVIKENVSHCGFDDEAMVITGDAVSALRRLEASGIKIGDKSVNEFDFVFMDPPYDQGLEDIALKYLSKSKLVNGDTKIIIEMSINADTEHFAKLGYEIEKIKSYKTNKHVFLRRQ